MSLRKAPFLFVLSASLVFALASCSREPGSDVSETPDQVAESIARGLADNQPQLLWQSLPASYQQDVNQLIHDAAASIDAELWNRTFGVLGKVSRLLKEKKQFILSHPMVAAKIENLDEAEANWDAIVKLFETIVDSELADLEQVASLDVDAFMSGTGARLMQKFAEAAALADDGAYASEMKALRKTEASVVSTSDDVTMVRIERPGKPPLEVAYVSVDGRWIPKKLAEQWPRKIAEAKQRMAEFSTQGDVENRQAVMMQLTMAESALDSILASQTADEFNAGVGALAGMALGAMMAHAGTDASSPEPGPTMKIVAENQQLEPQLEVSTDDDAEAGEVAQSSDSSPEEDEITEDFDAVARAGEGERQTWEVEPDDPMSLFPDPPLRVSANEASQFIGHWVKVLRHDGGGSRGKLEEVRADALVLRKELAGGEVAFEMKTEEIATVELIRR